MKKALFLVITSVVLASCGGKAPEGEATNVDTTVVETVDSTAVPTSTVSADTTATEVVK